MFLAIKGHHPPKNVPLYTVDQGCTKLLQWLVKESGASIVVSSTWRSRMDEVQHALEWAGFDDFSSFCIGRTPLAGNLRGEQIDEYIKGLTQGGVEVESYVILDDDSFDIHQKDRLVKTEHEVGLTVRDAHRALALLRGETPEQS